MKTLLFSLLSVMTFVLGAQHQDPVTWTAEFKKISDKEGEIAVTGIIQKGWHTYSQKETDAGPIPTTFSFAPSDSYSLEGSVAEAGAKEEFDKAFDAKLFVFHDKAQFTQKVRIKKAPPFTIPFTVEYMSCNDMMCLPPKTASLQVAVQK